MNGESNRPWTRTQEVQRDRLSLCVHTDISAMCRIFLNLLTHTLTVVGCMSYSFVSQKAVHDTHIRSKFGTSCQLYSIQTSLRHTHTQRYWDISPRQKIFKTKLFTNTRRYNTVQMFSNQVSMFVNQIRCVSYLIVLLFLDLQQSDTHTHFFLQELYKQCTVRLCRPT